MREGEKMRKPLSGLLAKTEPPVFYDNLDLVQIVIEKMCYYTFFILCFFTPVLGVIFNAF
jgi:hypothetical protein